jgi:hypothetical protein
MAVVRDVIKSLDNQPTVTAATKETLSLLMGLAQSKGEVYRQTIERDLITGKVDGQSLTVAITKILDRRIEYRSYVKTQPTPIIDSITKSLSSMFSGDGNILKSIGDVVQTMLNAIMGASQGDETEVEAYIVVADYPAIVRYDFAFWGRNVVSESITTYMENVFACVAYKSAVDVKKLAFNDFLALYGPVLVRAYGNDPTKLAELLKQAKDLYLMFRDEPAGLEAYTVDDLLAMGTETPIRVLGK